LSYTANQLTPDTVYTFLVQARNAVGLGASSSSVDIRASKIPNVPSAPSTTTVSNTDVTI